MPTPFLAYENAAILWEAPGERLTGRDGYGVAPGQAYLIGAFLKRGGDPAGVGKSGPGSAEFAGVGGTVSDLRGYVTRCAAIPAEVLAAASAWWLIDWATLEGVNLSGLAPEGFGRDSRGRAYLPGMGEGAATVQALGGAYGTAGIGAMLRATTGDPLTLELGQVGR